MSNTSEPFAKVEKFGEMYELHIGNGRMHNKDRRKTIVDCWANAINDDFEERCAARERESAAKALEEAAVELQILKTGARAEEVLESAPGQALGVAIDVLTKRAAAIRKGGA